MNVLQEVKKWIGEITEIFLLLIALGVAVEILLGSEVIFFGQVVSNLTGLVTRLGQVSAQESDYTKWIVS
jgi:hypothetical protein